MSHAGAAPPFRKLLIASRGEIAVRIIRACRDLGVASVAIFSEADRAALHVALADEAHPCGPPPARASYLDGSRILQIAKEAGADALHPGYGFLSENPDFARSCAEAGVVFVGPAPETIEAMGDKVAARRAMQAAGLPIVPGSTERQSDEDAAATAREIGFPVMIKAAAGGGGRGMRLVQQEAELERALKRARSEARSGFGDDAIYVEKALEQPRHIEVQILGDRTGQLIHLFERECSIQRRYQKLIEEAPANRLSSRLREELAQAAIAAATAAGYHGAGTVEFLLDASGSFYFLEMNTRIQVEHPITELVTNIDIVAAGIRIAAGEPLGIQQREVGLAGSAIECRIYAEDPAREFLPSPGEVGAYREPGGPGVRVDSGIRSGDTVHVHYDPLVAKLSCWGRNRAEAIARTRRALSEFVIDGIPTSIPFHIAALEHPAFIAGDYHTGFVAEELVPALRAQAEGG
ncbi:MAG: acetyl-CoA carboxylase biotin carboxylase subunit [Myxococcales bacterium]|nr:acetyl-CoA carboxylase biotin carboxylase subunit [Myxococcales bacterium]